MVGLRLPTGRLSDLKDLKKISCTDCGVSDWMMIGDQKDNYWYCDKCWKKKRGRNE